MSFHETRFWNKQNQIPTSDRIVNQLFLNWEEIVVTCPLFCQERNPEMWKKTHMKIKPSLGREATRQLHCWHHPDACRKSGGRHRYRFYFPQNPRPHVYTSHYMTPNVTLIYDAAVVKHVACVKMSAPWGPVGRSRKGEKRGEFRVHFFLVKGLSREFNLNIVFHVQYMCIYILIDETLSYSVLNFNVLYGSPFVMWCHFYNSLGVCKLPSTELWTP